ncbi:MAG: hypothetical protein ACR2GY_09125 [Phycisphaerales bacterium]
MDAQPLKLRTDIQRVSLGRFALPLGIVPVDLREPVQGYTVTYNPGENEEPDTYAFHIVVSHERLQPLLRDAFGLLPEEISPIIEVDSYDAYRTVDVYIGREDEPIERETFLAAWSQYEPLLLEDGAIGVGANSDEPFVEIFIDQWKALSIHVPLEMRPAVDELLARHLLSEVPATWPPADSKLRYEATIRPVLEADSEGPLTVDDVLVELRNLWSMELNIDPETNVDEGGRELGLTLWHAAIIVSTSRSDEGEDDDQTAQVLIDVDEDADEELLDEGPTAMLSVWASASSLSELEELILEALDGNPDYGFLDWYAVARVPFDNRPAQMDDLDLKDRTARVHLLDIMAEDADSEADPPEEHPPPPSTTLREERSDGESD